METHATTSNVEGTETLTLERWIKAQTLPFFWKTLARELDAGRTYEDCVRQMQGYFKAGNGAPTGRQLREIVNRMVQRKEAPPDFLSAWDRRRGRESAPPTPRDASCTAPQECTQVAEAQPRSASSPEPLPASVEENGSTAIAIVERTDVVEGWPLVVVEGESIPLMEDEEVGRRLGYADPRKIREMIRRIFNDSEIVRTVRQNPGRGRPATVFLLKRNQVLKLVMRSETAAADRMQDEIIAVYEAWGAGQRTAPSSSVGFNVSRIEAFLTAAGSFLSMAEKRDSAVVATLSSIESRLMALEHKGDASKKKARRIQKALLPAVPADWKSHRSVAASYGLPSADAPGMIVSLICQAASFAEDRELVRLAPYGAFRIVTPMLSPECIGRLEPALDAARQTMRDFGYQVSKRKALEPRPEVRPMVPATRVLEKMVEAARARLVPAAA